LLEWFQRNKRPLPWREQYTPYEVWVSEVMLQQTQMERGADYFRRWMRRFPDIASVAAASPEAVLKAWEGLGYYSRVRNLHKAAGIIMEKYHGQLPDSHAALIALPGIGEYTAGAILSIAFNQPVPAVDANVERVFARLFDLDQPVKSVISSDFIHHMAAALIPPGQARECNQALMELGALVCSRKARCELCPVAEFCQARHLGIQNERPVPGKRVGGTTLQIVSGVLVCKGKLFMQKRLDTGVWAGFWEFPGGRMEPGETPEEGIAREFFEETEFRVTARRYLGPLRHAYTRYRILMHCFVCAFAEPAEGLPPPALGPDGFPAPTLHAATAYRWLAPDEVAEDEGLTLPAGHRKLVDAWLPELRKIASCGNAEAS
jgi:A/G-specific adenine glycosylase